MQKNKRTRKAANGRYSEDAVDTFGNTEAEELRKKYDADVPGSKSIPALPRRQKTKSRKTRTHKEETEMAILKDSRILSVQNINA